MKGTALFQLLCLLSEETDEQHRLSAQTILNRMQERFGIKLNRRTLKSYLDELTAAGCPIVSDRRVRTLPDGSEEIMRSDWYLIPRYEVSELRLMHDLLSAMPSLPETQRKEILSKVELHASPTFRESVAENAVTYLHRPAAKQLLYSVERLCEAVRKNCMVRFQYGTYVLGENGQPELRPRLRPDGEIRQYFVSPYEIVVSQGKYYLICCKEPNKKLSNYRVDRIMNIELTENFERLPLSSVQDTVCYPPFPAEQLYMYRGETVSCLFRVKEPMLCVVLDWFGEHAEIAREDAENLLVRVQVHPEAMQRWAMQFSDCVTVLEPQNIRDGMIASAKAMLTEYEQPVPERTAQNEPESVH